MTQSVKKSVLKSKEFFPHTHTEETVLGNLKEMYKLFKSRNLAETLGFSKFSKLQSQHSFVSRRMWKPVRFGHMLNLSMALSSTISKSHQMQYTQS
jgi:hypothetical protein